MGRISPNYIVQGWRDSANRACHGVMSEGFARLSAEKNGTSPSPNVFHAGRRQSPSPGSLRPPHRGFRSKPPESLFPYKILEFMPRGRWAPSLAKHGASVKKKKRMMSKNVQRTRPRHHAASPLRVRPAATFQNPTKIFPTPRLVRAKKKNRGSTSRIPWKPAGVAGALTEERQCIVSTVMLEN